MAHLSNGASSPDTPACATAERPLADGGRAVMFYLVQRGDCSQFAPAAHIDPAYAEGVAHAKAAGVEVICWSAEVTAEGVRLDRPLST